MCTPLAWPITRIHDSSCSARLLGTNICSIVGTCYSGVCGRISLTCREMLEISRVHYAIDENAFHGRLMRCPCINYSRDKGKRFILPPVGEIPPGKNSLYTLFIVKTRDQDTRMRLARSLRLLVTWLEIIELIITITKFSNLIGYNCPDFRLYYIHFEITGYPCNLIGSQQCDLFLNRICSKSRHSCSKSHHFCLNRSIFVLYRIICVSNTKWDVKVFLFRLFNKPATRSIKY